MGSITTTVNRRKIRKGAKSNLQKQIAERRKHQQTKDYVIAMREIDEAGIYLPEPYQRNAPMTYGTGKKLTRISNTLTEVVG